MTRTHGLSGHPDYQLWKGMRARCNNPNHTRYVDYGGRGIKVCERWDDFPTFLADMGPRPSGYTLDRIDGDGDYEPSNCRWAPDSVQSRNRKDNVWLTHDGRRMVIQDWAAELGVRRQALQARLARGWSDEKTLTTPIEDSPWSRKPSTSLTHDGRTMSIPDWAREVGVSSYVIHSRLRSGWSVEKTLTTPLCR